LLRFVLIKNPPQKVTAILLGKKKKNLVLFLTELRFYRPCPEAGGRNRVLLPPEKAFCHLATGGEK